MGILDKYNKTASFDYDSNKERSFVKLHDLVEKFGKDKTYTVRALFINTKSRFGDEPVIFTDDYMINAPKHLLETVQDMRQDGDVVDLVNKSKVEFMIYGYRGKNGDGYSVEWIEK